MHMYINVYRKVCAYTYTYTYTFYIYIYIYIYIYTYMCTYFFYVLCIPAGHS